MTRTAIHRLSHRIGIVGYGFIGRALAEHVRACPETCELAFVHARRREQADDISDATFLEDLSGAVERAPRLVVETAHPAITRDHGADILSHADYLPLSTSALIDDGLRAQLLEVASANRTRLLLAAGALIGGEELIRRGQPWDRVRITFRKHPDNIDFSESGTGPEKITDATTLFDGPVREIAARFPRNVNTMVTAALLSTGLDACEGVLVADPSLDCAIAEVEAWGSDGGYMRTEKRQPATGVSGTEMVESAWHSIRQALRVSEDALQLV